MYRIELNNVPFVIFKGVRVRMSAWSLQSDDGQRTEQVAYESWSAMHDMGAITRAFLVLESLHSASGTIVLFGRSGEVGRLHAERRFCGYEQAKYPTPEASPFPRPEPPAEPAAAPADCPRSKTPLRDRITGRPLAGV